MIASKPFGLTIAIALLALPLMASAGAHSGIRRIFSGSASSETCVLMADYRVFCWGQTTGAASLAKIGKDIHSLALGFKFRCALTHDQQVYCWGHNDSGQLGDGGLIARDDPKPVLQFGGAPFDRATEISAGFAHVCALRDGFAWCWGTNETFAIGNFMLPRTDNALLPTQVIVHDSVKNPPLGGLRHISVGNYHSCALLADETGACWGADDYGQLANDKHGGNFNSPQTILVDSGGLQALVMGGDFIAAGGYATCSLVTDTRIDSVGCWGYNHEGELGNSSNTDSPVALPASDERGKIVDASAVAMSAYATCAIVSDTSIRCWGSDKNFELGFAAGGANQNVGVKLSKSNAGDLFTGAVEIVAGAGHFCARTLGDEVYCWGDNTFGQIGPIGTSNTSTPTKIAIDAPIFTDNLESSEYENNF